MGMANALHPIMATVRYAITTWAMSLLAGCGPLGEFIPDVGFPDGTPPADVGTGVKVDSGRKPELDAGVGSMDGGARSGIDAGKPAAGDAGGAQSDAGSPPSIDSRTVTMQQLIDDVTRPHEGGKFPYTPDYHGSAWGPTVSDAIWPAGPFAGQKSPNYVAPGPLAWSHVVGAMLWFELTTEENSPPVTAKVEIAEFGLASLSKSTGQWTLRDRSDANGLMAHGYLWGPNVAGQLADQKSAAGNSTYGWGSRGVQGKGFGDYVCCNYDGSSGRIRAHGWTFPWPGDKFFMTQNPNSDNALSDPVRNADVAALAWWMTLRVTGADSATARYRILPGVDLKMDGQTNNPTDRGAYTGRARIVRPEWQTITGHTMSPSMLAAHPPSFIPGYVK